MRTDKGRSRGTLAVVPARLESTRLPRKMLLSLTGRPLVVHTVEAVVASGVFDDVVVATDSREIADAVREAGYEAAMTGPASSGTDRIAAVVREMSPQERPEIVVNVQGDEPEIEPSALAAVVDAIAGTPAAEMATLSTPLTDAAGIEDPARVKVVTAADGRALYFSRAPIPFVRDAAAGADFAPATPWALHIGTYAYRTEFLLRFAGMPPSRLERLEGLEQLRALEAGATIAVASVGHAAVGIDTAEDYARFVARHAEARGVRAA
ncbi:MAG: 3-deoxy-manno-octulosonate cytidylyltransferase [Planctomycetota bacterium]